MWLVLARKLVSPLSSNRKIWLEDFWVGDHEMHHLVSEGKLQHGDKKFATSSSEIPAWLQGNHCKVHWQLPKEVAKHWLTRGTTEGIGTLTRDRTKWSQLWIWSEVRPSLSHFYFDYFTLGVTLTTHTLAKWGAANFCFAFHSKWLSIEGKTVSCSSVSASSVISQWNDFWQSGSSLDMLALMIGGARHHF